jgi:1A family penicillin-binding protein
LAGRARSTNELAADALHRLRSPDRCQDWDGVRNGENRVMLDQRARPAARPRPDAPGPPTPPAPPSASPARRPNPILRFVARLAALALVAGAVLALLVAQLVGVASGLRKAAHATTSPLVLPPLDERSIVYAADGSVLAYLHSDTDRNPVTLDQVSPVLVNAVIDTEDDQFWHHGGVEGRSIGRAISADVRSGGVVQGGSTITQQLVKNTFLTPKRDVGRKVKEMILATRLEQQLGKRAILERYFNTVYFGEGAYGVEAAAERYFNATSTTVTPAQAAMLAGLIRDPVGNDPVLHPDAARHRRSVVLELMAEHGHLAPAEQAAADRSPLPTAPVEHPQGHDYFTDAVRQQLLADSRLGSSAASRYHAVFGGGLRIHTTVDPAMQRAAEAAVAQGLPHVGRPLDAAVAAVDPATGAVRALVGGSNFGSSQFDLATQGARQPGSSFKTFSLVTALEQGWRPETPIDGGAPCPVSNPGGTPNPWLPDNFEGEAFGVIPLSDATAHSVNCAYARLGQQVGLGAVVRTAHDMGIASRLHAVPSMVLGTNVVTPLEMASAYATLAADGVYHPPHLIEEVDGPSGKPVFRNDGKARRVLPPDIAREATAVLRGVVQNGTGTAAALPGRDVAGKTGTAENYQDAWFVGYAAQLATAVWMGDPHGEVPMTNVAGINVVGGTFPAQIWHAFMAAALAGRPAVGFLPPNPANLPAPAQGTPGATTGGTTWCWSSCNKGGQAPPSPAPAPGPPGHKGH